MAPDEAAPILADFAGKLNMEMSGKFWAPSTFTFPPLPPSSSFFHHVSFLVLSIEFSSVAPSSARPIVLLSLVGH